MPLETSRSFIDRYVDNDHASIVVMQVHMGINVHLTSKVRGILCNRDNALKLFKGVKFYPGFINYDNGYFKANGLQHNYTVSIFFLFFNIYVF